MSHSLAAEYRSEFFKIYGRDYDPVEFTTPQAILDLDLQRLVARLKISDANAEQTEIHYEIQKFKKGDVVILPDDKKHLVEEFEDAKKMMELWEPFSH